MPKPRLEALVEFLLDRYGEDLRWVATYDTASFDYRFHHIRTDVKDDLKGRQLDHVIHRSLAVYNKRHAEEVYFHLGESDYLIVDYELGTAFHLFLDDRRGVTVMLEPDTELTLPTFVDECRSHLGSA
ncbi:MAG: hypothetical protein R3324_11890 [Halobacteriales archaeon]|nr:hypothetical protein [Halobacteriales archaeon]